MVVAMSVVITEYTSIVARKRLWINIGKTVPGYSSCVIPPDLLFEQRKFALATKVRLDHFIPFIRLLASSHKRKLSHAIDIHSSLQREPCLVHDIHEYLMNFP